MLQFDPLLNPYHSQRMVVYGINGMVATSQPLAAQAGLQILKQGGNAIDAAIAMATCLTVVEPTSNGIGGDTFALVWANGKLHGLNSSGPAPAEANGEVLLKSGIKQMPTYGWLPVTVPGAPAAWAELSLKFGELSLTKVMEQAIDYAENGYPVSPIAAKDWRTAFETYKETLKGEEFKHWFETFAPEGHSPEAGSIWRSSNHAATLKKIAETNSKEFYQGELAEKIESFSKQYNGYLRKTDLENFKPEWVEPVKINYRGYDVWELPPNGHGIVALMALNILKGFEFTHKDCVETYHKQIEAMKLAYADGLSYIGEPGYMKVRVQDLLSDAYAYERRKIITTKALEPQAGSPIPGGTVYLAAADNKGNMISLIQSNYKGFGSALVVPETGIALHNRGYGFSLDPSHPNFLQGGKRPYHTIIPGFLTKDNTPIGPFGVMGAFMQPQGHVQVVMNTIDFKLNPQAALDSPRWQWINDRNIELERNVPDYIAQKLAHMGHNIRIPLDQKGFGRGQIIWKMPNGVYAGGTEPRTDGAVLTW